MRTFRFGTMLDTSTAEPATACRKPATRSAGNFEEQMGPSDRTSTLAQLAASIALGASPVTYARITAYAHMTRATDGEVLGTLFAVAPIVGGVRVAAAAPHIAAAIGYDLEAAFEVLA
jgi:alkylhydroperoxidase/carboxymuconolactone decarboxylase family protein YurZ